MRAHVFQRMLLTIPTLLAVLLITILLTRAIPGGPGDETLSHWRASSIELSSEQKESLRSETFDSYFGNSHHYQEPAWKVIARHLPVTLTLGFFSALFTYCIGIGLGLLQARFTNSFFDRITTAGMFGFTAIPSFILAVYLLRICSSADRLALLPLHGFGSGPLDICLHLLLPVICISSTSVGSLALLTKTTLEEILTHDFIRSARSRGVSEKAIYLKHALRGSAATLTTHAAQWLAFFCAGNVVIEVIFGLHGLGELYYFSMLRRDYPIVIGILALLVFTHSTTQCLSDYLHSRLDPRVDFRPNDAH